MKQCGSVTNVDFEILVDDVHVVLAGRIRGASSDGEANSLGSDLVKRQRQECE